jgi:hypothetical protein
LAAIGGSYADRETAIVEKYWTTNSLAVTLEMFIVGWQSTRAVIP